MLVGNYISKGLNLSVEGLHVGDQHAVGWGEGPCVLVTPVKVIRVGMGDCKSALLED